MWAVIRRAQGLSLNEEPAAASSPVDCYDRNQRCILMHEAKAAVPYMDPRIMTRAYGEFHYEKVRRWLLDDDARLRLQAADQLIEMYTEQREHRVRSLAYDALPILFSILCADEEEVLRERAGAALEMLVREPITQDQIIKAEALGPEAHPGGMTPLDRVLTVALQDSCDAVVALVLRVTVACHSYTNSFAVTERLVALDAIPKILERVAVSENPLVCALACASLVPVFDIKEAHVIFQRCDGVRIVTEAIRTAEDDMLVAEAAEALSRAAEWPQGKRDAVTCKTISALINHMDTGNLTARVAVLAALAQITVWEPARFQALETDRCTTAITALVAVEDERDVIAHLAQLIFHLSDEPGGRRALRPCRDRLIELLGFADSEDLTVRLVLQNAVDTLARKCK